MDARITTVKNETRLRSGRWGTGKRIYESLESTAMAVKKAAELEINRLFIADDDNPESGDFVYLLCRDASGGVYYVEDI